MSSLSSNRNWLVVSFYLRVDGRSVRVRLYPGLRDTRQNRRGPEIKQLRDLIVMRSWRELAEKFPNCKQLAGFRTTPRPDITNFREASERFLVYQGNANSKATTKFYRTILHAHIWTQAEFAAKPLRLIGASDVAAVYGPVHQAGHQAQAANVRRVISAVFNWARGERGVDGDYLVIDNPVTRTKPVKIDRPEDSIDPFTLEEIQAILHSCDGWVRRVITVAIGTGLDPGENFGLKRQNLDFANRKLRVRQRFTRYGVGGLKNPRRRREVDLEEPVYLALREQMAATELRSPWLWPISKFRPDPHNPQRFSARTWPAVLKRAGVNHREFYQCRHTFATLHLRAGAEWQWVADQMGHRDLQMLTKVYWKWRPGSTSRPQRDIIREALAL